MRPFARFLSRPLFVAAVAFAGSACIAWRGDLEELDTDVLVAPEKPRALTLESEYRSNGKLQDSPSKDSAQLAQETLEEEKLFASVASIAPGETRGDLHLVLRFEETYNEGAVMASGFLCGLTFFLFPGYAKADISLEAELWDRGVPRGSVKIEDDVKMLMQILLLPASPFFWPGRVGDKMMRNLVLHAVHDLMPELARRTTPSP